MLPSSGTAPLPTDADIHKLIAQLRDDMTAQVRTEVTDRLLGLIAAEPHPMVKAAMLERAARLVAPHDRPRAVGLLRESFRLSPTPSVGGRLLELAEDDLAFRRLNRLGHLVDALVAIADTPQDQERALREAVQAHLTQGHGHAAAATLRQLREVAPEEADLQELAEIAEQQIQARAEVLSAQRMEIATCADEDRPRALLAYAELLLAGDEPLADAAAVLADAVDNGASLVEATPLWVEVARAMGDSTELTRALHASLLAGDTLPTRLQHADELANIPNVDRQFPEAALAALAVLAEALPDDLVVRARLETTRALQGGAGAEEALEGIRQRALRERDRVGESVASLALAQLAQAQGDLEKAERHFRRVRTLSPSSPEALDFFEQYYRSSGDHKRLLVALSQRLATAEGKEVVRLALEVAQLAEGPLASPERAIEAYQRVLGAQPDHPVATPALERLFFELGRWHALRDLLDRAARPLRLRAATDPAARDQAVALLARIAALHEDPARLPDRELALETHRQILTLAPRHPEALNAVVRAQGESGDWTGAKQTLEQALTVAADPGERAELLGRLGSLQAEHLGDDAGAARSWKEAVRLAPNRTELVRFLQDAARRAGDQDALLEALLADIGRRLGRGVTDTLPAELAVGDETERNDLQRVLEEALGLAELSADRAELALHLARVLLALQPGHVEAIAALERGLGPAGRLNELAEVLEPLADDTRLPTSRRVAVLEQLARLYDGPLRDMSRAQAAAQRLRALDSGSQTARTISSHFHVQQGDLSALRELHGPGTEGARPFVEAALAAAAQQQGGLKVGMLLVVSQTQAEELAEVEPAAMTLADALTAVDEIADEAERRARGVEVAETLLQRSKAAGLVGLQRLAVESLVQHGPAEEQPRYKQLRVDLCADAGLWTEAAVAAADLAEDLLAAGEFDGLGKAVRQADFLASKSEDDVGLAGRLAAWADLLDEDAQATAALGDTLGWMWFRAAELSLSQADLETARKAAERAVALQAQQAEGNRSREAWRLLERICSEQADWPRAVDALEQLAEQEESAVRAETWLRAAVLADHSMGDRARAEGLYRKVLTIKPQDTEAWTGLVAAVRPTGDLDALAAALDGLLALPDLSRDTRARATLERMETEAALSPEQESADPLACAAGLLDNLASFKDMLEAEQQILQVALGWLEVPERAASTARRLLPVLRHHDLQDEALQALDVLARTEAPDSERAVEWLLQIADLAERSQPTKAWQALRDALAADPKRRDVDDRLVALSEKLGKNDEFDLLLLALVGEAEIPGVVAVEDAGTRRRLAQLRGERALRAGDGTTAASLFTLLHALAPDDVGPLDVLEALYREAGDADAVAFVLEERLRASIPRDERVGTWLRLAALHGDERGAPEEAADVLGRATTELPDSPELWASWLTVLRDLGDRARLASALQKRLDQLANSGNPDAVKERQAVRLEVADLLEDREDGRRQALAHWLDALENDPTDERAASRATESLQALAQAAGLGDPLAAPTESARVIQQAAQRLEEIHDARGDLILQDVVLGVHIAATPREGKAKLLLHQAFLRERGLADPASAFEALALALQLEPGRADLQAEARRLASGGTPSHPDPIRAADAFVQAADAAPKGPIRKQLRQDALDLLGDRPQGLDLTRRVLDGRLADDPSDAEALERLEDLARASGDDRARLGILAARAKATANKAEQAELRLEHAQLAEQLGEETTALQGFRSLLDVKDLEVRRTAAAALCDIHERRGEQREFADALMVLRGAIEDGDGRRALALRAAAVLVQYGDLDRARTLLVGEALEHPRDPDVWRALADLLRKGTDRQALADHFRLGWQIVFLGEQEARDQAAAEWLDALPHAPGTAGERAHWHALTEVLDAGVRGPAVSQALDAAAETLTDPELALVAAQRRVSLRAEADDAPGEVAARLELLDRFSQDVDARAERAAVAHLLEKRLDDAEGALSQWRALLATELWDPYAVSEAQRLADRLGIATEIDDELASAVARLNDPAARVAARMALVDRASARKETARLVDLLDQVLADDPDHADAYELRGLALTELPEWHHTDRLAKHWRHGMAHAARPDDRLQARLKLASLLHEHLGRSGEAFGLVREVLADQPDLLPLAVELGDAAGKRAEVRELLADQARGTEEAAERAGLWALLALRCLDEDADLEAARTCAEQALSAQPTDETALSVLDRLCDKLVQPDVQLLVQVAEALAPKRPDRSATLLQRAIDAADPAQKPLLLRRLAEVAPAARAAGADLDAVGLARDLALAEPTEPQHWERLAQAAGDAIETVQDALLTAADATQDPGLRHDLLARAAMLSAGRGDVDAATAWWRLALETQERSETRGRLHDALDQLGRQDELAVSLEAAAEQGGESAADLLLRAASLWLGPLEQPARGLALLDRLAHDRPDDRAVAEQRLEALQRTGDARFPAELERWLHALRKSANTGRLPHWLAVRAQLAAEDLDVATAARTLAELERAGGEPAQQTATLTWLQENLGDLPEDLARLVLGWRLQTLDPATDPEGWCGVRLAQADLVETPAERAELWLDLGRHARDRLQDNDLAIEWLARAVSHGAEAALDDLTALVGDARAATNLANTSQILLGDLPADRRSAVAARLFEAAVAQLGDDPALTQLAEACAGERLDAALWLEDQARAAGDQALLGKRLESRADRLAGQDPAAAVDAWLQLADLQAESLGDKATAARTLDRLLAVQPDHEAALRMRLSLAQELDDTLTVARLAELLASQSPSEAADLYVLRAKALEATGDRSAALEACDLALLADERHGEGLRLRARLLHAMGREVEARQALLAVAQAIGDVGAAPMLLQAAEMALQAGDPADAARLYARLLVTAPTDERVWAQVRKSKQDGTFVAALRGEIGEALAAHPSLAAELQALALPHLPAAERDSALRALASLWAGPLAEPRKALDLLLEEAETAEDPLTWLAEAGDVARTADEGQPDGEGFVSEWIDRVADLVSHDSLPKTATEPAIALVAAAAAELGDLDRAADLWEIAWEMDPDSVEARQAVLALRREAGDPQRLASALERALVLGDAAERGLLRVELAELKKNLGRPRDALRLVAEVLGSEPNHAEALALATHLLRNPACAEEAASTLEPLFRTARNWTGLADVLRAKLEREQRPAQKAELARELARLEQDQLQHAGQAIQALLTSLEADPRPSTLEAVEQLATPQQTAEVARAFELTLAAPNLAPVARVAVLTRAAAHDRARGDEARAEQRLREALRLLPAADEPFEALEALLDAAGRWDDLIAAWKQRVAALTDSDARKVGLHRLAGLARASGQAATAVEALRELATLDPNDAEPLDALAELYREADEPAALVDVLAQRAALQDDPKQRAALLVEAARLCHGKRLQQEERAADLYELSFELDPTLDEAFVYLERRAGHEARHLQPLYARRAEALEPGPSRTLILRRLAHAASDLGDGGAACAALEKALIDDPHNAAVLDELQRTAEAHRQWRACLVAVEHKLAGSAGELRKEQRVPLLGLAARILLTEAAEPGTGMNSKGADQAAARHIQELQEIAPKEPLTRHLLALLQSHSGNPQEAVAGLEQMVKEVDDPATQISLHQKLADLYAGPLESPAKAIREYQRLIALDPRRWSARRKLCDLYAARRSDEALAESLKQWLAVLGEVQDRVTLQLDLGRQMIELMTELGEVLIRLGQLHEATQILGQAHELGGHEVKLDTLLAEMYEATGETRGAAEMHAWLVEHFAPGTDKAKLAHHAVRAGQLFERLGDIQQARLFYKRALEVRPDDDDATLGSARVCLALGEIDRAMRLYDAVSRKPPGSIPHAVRADAHVGMGRCRLARLQLDQARACYERALQISPGHPAAVEALAEL